MRPPFAFPGIEKFENLEAEMAEKLCQLLLGSIPEWDRQMEKYERGSG